MKLKEVMIAWTADLSYTADDPMRGQVKVGPWPDKHRWSDAYDNTEGMCDLDWHQMSDEGRLLALFVLFHALVVRDGINPQVAHEAFLEIDEYRQRIAPDIAGAEDWSTHDAV